MKKEKKWEAFHYQLLKELFAKGESLAVMANRLDATQADVRAKLNAFGLHRVRGRKPIGRDSETEQRMITVRVSEAFHAEYAKACAANRKSLNKAAVELMEKFVKATSNKGCM